MINTVSPGSVSKIDNRNIALVHIENINCYIRACWALNVPSSSLFMANDLFTKRDIPQVNAISHSILFKYLILYYPNI